MPDPPVSHFCLLERAGKGRHQRQTQLNMVCSGIRERLFWDVGSTQKEEGKGKKGNIKFKSDAGKGKGHKIRRSRNQEGRNIIPLHSLSEQSICWTGEWFAGNHQRDRGITTALQAILTHKSLPKQLHTNKFLLWNSLPVNWAALGEINQSDTNYIQKLQVMTSCRKSPALFLRKPVGDTILLFL